MLNRMETFCPPCEHFHCVSSSFYSTKQLAMNTIKKMYVNWLKKQTVLQTRHRFVYIGLPIVFIVFKSTLASLRLKCLIYTLCSTLRPKNVWFRPSKCAARPSKHTHRIHKPPICGHCLPIHTIRSNSCIWA